MFYIVPLVHTDVDKTNVKGVVAKFNKVAEFHQFHFSFPSGVVQQSKVRSGPGCTLLRLKF